MLPNAPLSAAGAPVSGRLLLRALALVAAFALLLYGLAAIDAGVVNFRAAQDPTIAAERIAMQHAAERGESLGEPAEVARHSSAMLAFLASVSSPEYAFGKQGLSEALIHYATMPSKTGIALALHSMLGGAAMMFGALQFWPAFRKRYPRWHRGFGIGYIAIVQASMVGATLYLIRTPVNLIYDQFTFYVGLWFLDISVTLTLWLAVHALARRRIGQHQAWMAMNYGMLLTAPMQRFGWLAFGAAAPHLRQLEANYAVTSMLIPLGFMLGYGLYTANRWLQAYRTAPSAQQLKEQFAGHAGLGRWMAIGMLPILAFALLTILPAFTTTAGYSAALNANTLIPATVLQMDHRIMAAGPLTRWLFVSGTAIGVLGAIFWLRHDVVLASQRRIASRRLAGGRAMVAGSAVVGTALLLWGTAWGMPSFANQHGGALNLFGGTTTLCFAALMASALQRGWDDWAREWSWFLMACLIATPSFFWLLPLLGQVGIPAAYVETGHVYRMAAYGGWMSLIIAFVVAAYSPATHARVAR